MVEGPGCKLNGEKLRKRVLGQRVKDLSGTFLLKSTIQKSTKQVLVGKRVTDVKTLGKELFVFVEGESCLRVHFLMNGSLRFNTSDLIQSSTKRETPVLKLNLTRDCVYFYHISLEFRSGPECQQKYEELIDLDVCSPTFDQQRAVHTIRQHPTRLICDVLLDQRVLPGVGNIIKNEALFDSGINPNTKVNELSEELIFLLVKMNRDFTKLFYECRRDGKNLHKFMKVYKKMECHECQRKLVQCKVGEYARLTFYCPACQNNTMRLPTNNCLLGWLHFKQDVWSCVACTLKNKTANKRCCVCLTPRPPPHTTTTTTTTTTTLHYSTPTTANKRPLQAGMQDKTNSKKSAPGGPLSLPPALHHATPTPHPPTSQGRSGEERVVVCPGHKAAARKCKVVKDGDNKGRLFYTCTKPQGQQCKFFLWGDEHHPMCHHGKVTLLRTVLKLNANNGRHFYCCSRPKGKQCNFFQWVDAE